jgi:glycosyltransferase involved in cell wall biosynthesis
MLFDVTTATQLTLAAETARRVKKLGVKVGLNFSGGSDDVLKAVRRTADELTCRFSSQAEIAAEAANRQPSRAEAFFKRVRNAARRRAEKVLDITPNRIVDHLARQFRDEIAAARLVLRRHRPAAIVVGEDGVSGNGPLIRAAQEAGIVVLVLPYEISGREDFVNYVEEKRREGRLLTLGDSDDDRRVAERHPNWILPTSYGDVVIYPSHFILAREIAGLGVPDPWTTHGGTADYLAVGSESMREHYRREGLPEEKLIGLGSPYCDAMSDVLAADATAARAFAQATKIVPGRTRILISLPPSYHETRPGTSEFPTYEAMCRATVDACLSVPGAEVTLSIHPATPPEQQALLRRMDVTIFPEWVIRLIPRHDIFVTTFSSTIRWALACGKPVINYDAYQFRLEAFREARAMTTVRRTADLATQLTALADDETFARAAQRAAADSHNWGSLDGQNTRRIVKFLKRARPRGAPGPLRRVLEAVGLL